MEQLPTAYALDEENLVEITDSHVLARIDNLVPSIGSTGASIGNAIRNAAAQNETLYRVVLQKGGQLVNSRATAGAKRAFTMAGNRIQGNAELIPVDQVVDKGALVANAGAAVMGVASMVVGQYYIAQEEDVQIIVKDGKYYLSIK